MIDLDTSMKSGTLSITVVESFMVYDHAQPLPKCCKNSFAAVDLGSTCPVSQGGMASNIGF